MMKKHNRFLTLTLIVILATFLIPIQGCGGKSRPSFDAQYDVIIIGGGVGGMSAATTLANKGLKVLLLEQHNKVGGCATDFKRGDFTFNTAMHLLVGAGDRVPNEGLNKLLVVNGVYDKMKLYELPDYYRSLYPGIDFRVPNRWDELDTALKERWPEESAGVDKFHKLCADLYNDTLSIKDIFRMSGFKAFLTKAKIPFKQKTLFDWKDKTLADLMDECFTNDDIKAVLNQTWVYYGAPVKDQSALFFMSATNAIMTYGTYHVFGTAQAMSDAYAERIRELGGEVKTGTLVTKIIIEDGLARGVETEFGDTYTARYVICNTDPYQMIFKLIGEENLPKDYVNKVKNMKIANSLFGVYLGLNIDLKKLGYTDTEIIYSSDKDSTKIYDNMMKGDFADGASSISIYSNFEDPIYAPPGKSCVVLHAYSDYDAWPKDRDEYQKMREEKAWEQIRLAARIIPELADPKNIEVLETVTPLSLEEYTMNYKGVPYGFYLDTKQWDKIPNDTPIDNIFIASNWSQAWFGMGAGQVNGWRAARLILDREGIE
jgi:phytoene dehydrogenase-like protein